MEKILSIIIPVYNTSKYIEKCLNSILNQSMNNLEIIIVNDGSTDNSEEIIKNWIEQHKNQIDLKYFKKENGGLSDARNYGIQKCIGEYITFVDSDDYLGENIYKNLEKYMEEKIDVIKFKMSTVDEDGQIIKKLDGPIFSKSTGEEAFEKLYTTDTYLEVSCIYLYRREFFIENNFQFELNAYHEDFGLIPWVIINAKSVVSTEYFGYFYLQRENSITDTTDSEKEKKKAYDILKHYDNAIKRTENTIFRRYYTNVLLLKVNNLKGKEQQQFIKCIKTRKVYKNIKPENLKQLLKRILVKTNIKLYLKLR